MARIGRPGVLGVIDRLFAVDDAVKAPGKIGLNAAITLVHDVSRQAERGAAFGLNGGFYTVGGLNAHAAANTQANAYYPLNLFANLLRVQHTELSVWLLSAGAQCAQADSGNITRLACAVLLPERLSIGPGTGGPTGYVYRPILYAVTGNFTVFGDKGGVSAIAAALSNSALDATAFAPIPLPYDSYITQRSVSSGAVDITFSYLCWVGRAGTTPPGMP